MGTLAVSATLMDWEHSNAEREGQARRFLCCETSFPYSFVHAFRSAQNKTALWSNKSLVPLGLALIRGSTLSSILVARLKHWVHFLQSFYYLVSLALFSLCKGPLRSRELGTACLLALEHLLSATSQGTSPMLLCLLLCFCDSDGLRTLWCSERG